MLKKVSDLSKGIANIFRRLEQITKAHAVTAIHLGGQIEKSNFQICTNIEEVQTNLKKNIDSISSQLAIVLSYLKAPSSIDKKGRRNEN